MKHLLKLLFLFPIVILGQNSTQNYILTTIYKDSTQNSISAPTLLEAAREVVYLDGLGKPIFKKTVGQANNDMDIVTPIGYDAFGRQVKDYLPYVDVNPSNLDIIEPTTAIQNQFNYYNDLNNGEITSNPYSEKLLENSPLNRVQKQAAPGNDWALPSIPSDPDHTVKMKYETNVANEVKMFKANAEWDSGIGLYAITLEHADGGTFYKENQLYKTVTFDENTDGSLNETNGSTVEFKDKEGKVILKRTYNNGEAYNTYYVFDQYGNLTYVVPPKADGAITPEILNDLCYQYKYDYRNRLVEKKLPGKQWEFIVYDKLDRVVATGPAYSPFSDLTNVGWMISKYDVFNRPIVTGWLPSNTTINNDARQSLQGQVNNQTNNLSESKINGGGDTTINDVGYRYTNDVFPTNDFHVLTVNYYDDYLYPNAPTDFNDVEGEPVFYNNSTKPRGLPTGSWVRVLETSNAINAETSYTLYDYKARPIKSYKKNYLGGYTNVVSKLDFSGKTLYTITYHKRDNGCLEIKVEEQFTYSPQDRLINHIHFVNNGTPELIAHNEYDKLGQLIVKKVGGQDLEANTSYQTINYKYNIRGWLTDINNSSALNEIGDNDLFGFKINYNTPIDGAVSDAVPLYNGNISATYWNNASDNNERKYEYQYDQLNRLSNAVFQKINSNLSVNYYGESMGYDKNGNIQNLSRNGNSESNIFPNPIDELQYFYADNSNQLLKVSDETNNTSGFKDDTDQNSQDLVDDYEYDANGNMISDQNKNINLITYNHLNLPKTISFGSLGSINYLYNALGQKVKKTVLENGKTNATDYLDGYQYLNTYLKFFPTAEGYVNAYQDTGIIQQGSYLFNYVYSYTDHLGNVRLSYAKDPKTNTLKILEQNHYYPFGLKHENYNSERKIFAKEEEAILQQSETSAPAGIFSMSNAVKMKIKPSGGATVVYGERNYKYQGQERQDELGLNWDSFKWRNYDYAIGRFMSIDPLAEKYAYNSPYAIQENKMGMGRELEGLELVEMKLMTYFAVKYVELKTATTGAKSNLNSAVNNRFNAYVNGSDKSNSYIAGKSVNIDAVKDIATIAKSVKTIQNETKKTIKEVSRAGFDAMEAGGDAVVVSAPLAGPAAPAVAGTAEVLSTIGTVGNITMDVMEGNIQGALERAGTEVVTGGLSKLAKNAPGVNETTSQIIDAHIEVYDNVVIPAIEKKIEENK